MPADKVLIVGGGVSGLSTAYFLAKNGISSTIVEKAPRTGGLIRTDQIEGCRLEAGPDSYISTKPAVTALAQELPGLQDQIIGSNDQARRVFIARNGKLLPMPKGMVMMVPGQWSPVLRSKLLSASAKIRLLKETMFSPRDRAADISVGQLVEEHFGHEVLEYFTEPLLCGVYGGDSENLSAESVLPRFAGYERKYGSLIKGVRHEVRTNTAHGSLFLSLRDGMQSLTDALSAAIASHANVVHAEATQVARSDSGWRVKLGAESVSAREVVLASPAHACASLLETAAPSLAANLAAIPYSSAILVMLVFDRAALNHPLNGFGFLVPRGERQTLAAATWVNTKFPIRVRPDLAALRAFVVGDHALRLQNASNGEIVSLVREDFRRLMGINAAPLFHTVYRWPLSMPQYVVGHHQRLRTITDELMNYQGLFLAGNAYDGIGIPDCVRRAKLVAEHISANRV